MDFKLYSKLVELFTNNPDSKPVLMNVLSVMEEALNGKLSPSFNLFPIDTGLGKSTLIRAFLIIWMASGFPGTGSVLIALSSIEEIKDFISDLESLSNDYAVFTRVQTQSAG